MSLVAYAASSDDESSSDNDEKSPRSKSDGQISDEEDFTTVKDKQIRKALILPVPKLEEHSDTILPFLAKLPIPKASHGENVDLIEEEDDEFLHKKAIPLEIPRPSVPSMTKSLVRITIPSLKDFDDVEERKVKKTDSDVKPLTFSNLMSILPQPKSEKNFVKAKPTNNPLDCKESSNKISLVPDTVKNSRPAQNTENIDRKVAKKLPPKPKPMVLLVNASDSDESDNEDFFSLNSDGNLPDVSAEEISAMVSKKAAQMAKVSSKFVSIVETNTPEPEAELPSTSTNINTQNLDNEAIQALIGSQGKRRKINNVEIIDISSDQVLPNKDEWLRTALASATTYQATGVLTDEEPAAGTRRKHQITYLAHKAKANEAELQAMWSTNRQNRRQTQSKYGF